jgi:hypothetical protein
MVYAVIFKRKSARNWQSAVLSKKGVTLTKLKTFISKYRKPGFDVKIISVAALKKLLARKKSRKKAVKRKVVRRKVARKKKR